MFARSVEPKLTGGSDDEEIVTWSIGSSRLHLNNNSNKCSVALSPLFGVVL